MEKPEDLITDGQITDAFGNADFGTKNKRDVVKFTLLKYASGYDSGHTAMCILQDLGLLTQRNQLSQRGKRYLWAAFYQDGNSY